LVVLTGEGRKNEGTGFDGRVEGSLERQDWKDGMTREIRNLRRLAIFCFVKAWTVCVRKMGVLYYIGRSERVVWSYFLSLFTQKTRTKKWTIMTFPLIRKFK
jgi:hypothetical protein